MSRLKDNHFRLIAIVIAQHVLLLCSAFTSVASVYLLLGSESPILAASNVCSLVAVSRKISVSLKCDTLNSVLPVRVMRRLRLAAEYSDVEAL